MVEEGQQVLMDVQAVAEVVEAQLVRLDVQVVVAELLVLNSQDVQVVAEVDSMAAEGVQEELALLVLALVVEVEEPVVVLEKFSLVVQGVQQEVRVAGGRLARR